MPTTYEVTSLAYVAAERARSLGRGVNELINTGENREMLHGRHLLGVLDRFGESPDAAVASMRRAMIRSRVSVSDPTSPRNTAFVVCRHEDGAVVGMGTVIEGLELYRHRRDLRLPPHLARNFGLSVLQHEIVRSHPNLSAWVSTEEASDMLALSKPLMQTYQTMLETTGGRGWTLVPHGNFHAASVYVETMDVGFEKVATGRFDEMEPDGWHAPPISDLFVASPK